MQEFRSEPSGGVFDNQAFKEARLTQFEGTEVSAGMFNLIIGGVLMWGLFVDFLIAYFFGDVFMNMNSILMIVIYFVMTIGGMILVYRSKQPALSFVGFTVMAAGFGILIASIVGAYTTESITYALIATVLITAVMMLAGMLFPSFFLGLGRVLLLALGALVLVSIVLALFGIRLGVLSYVGIGLFSLYVAYDWAKAQQYPKTLDNAIDSAADIFMDIVNIFIRILSIIGKRKD